MPLPNFFIVGAPKSGTTALYEYLSQHPAIYMSPIKEPTFFAPEVVEFGPETRRAFERDADALQAYLDGPMRERRNTGIVTDWAQYLTLFKHVRDETAVGEASVSYLGSLGAPRAIRQRIPDAKILMMLRDPTERLFSHYASAYGIGVTDRTFLQWVDDELAAEATRTPPFGPIWAGRYGQHLQRVLAEFPVSQVRVDLYDDFVTAPARTVASIFTFLAVDPDWPIDLTTRHNVTLVPRWARLQRRLRPATRVLRRLQPEGASRIRAWTRVPLRQEPTANERARVIELYAPEIRTLEALIRRDLPAWLDPDRRTR